MPHKSAACLRLVEAALIVESGKMVTFQSKRNIVTPSSKNKCSRIEKSRSLFEKFGKEIKRHRVDIHWSHLRQDGGRSASDHRILVDLRAASGPCSWRAWLRLVMIGRELQKIRRIGGIASFERKQTDLDTCDHGAKTVTIDILM